MKILMFSDYQLPIVACCFLFFAMITYWISLAIPKNTLVFKVSKILVFLSNLVFALTLLLRWVFEHYFPLSNLYESLIFLSWGISSLHLIIEAKTKSRLIGSISTPILFFISGFSSLTLPTDMQKALPLVPSLQSNWLMMHVSMMMISYATLIIGSLLSLLYLAFNFFNGQKKDSSEKSYSQNTERLTNSFQDTNLQGLTSLSPLNFNSSDISLVKELEVTNFSRNALLQTVDTWSYRIIGLGFPFLTIGIISGAVWANEAWGSYWSWDPKETWALITWLTFSIYFHMRITQGLQGRKPALVASFGFIVIWVCYLGVNLLGKGLHSYGWWIQ